MAGFKRCASKVGGWGAVLPQKSSRKRRQASIREGERKSLAAASAGRSRACKTSTATLELEGRRCAVKVRGMVAVGRSEKQAQRVLYNPPKTFAAEAFSGLEAPPPSVAQCASRAAWRVTAWERGARCREAAAPLGGKASAAVLAERRCVERAK